MIIVENGEFLSSGENRKFLCYIGNLKQQLIMGVLPNAKQVRTAL
jgi:hypothetical protein